MPLLACLKTGENSKRICKIRIVNAGTDRVQRHEFSILALNLFLGVRENSSIQKIRFETKAQEDEKKQKPSKENKKKLERTN